MKTITLRHVSEDPNIYYQATFAPDNGLNLLSFKKGNIELIDQSTKDLFDSRLSGLGPIIGPHFHHRKEQDIPFIPDPSMFPQIQLEPKPGQKEIFSHGIARYVPWNIDATDTTLTAHISGMDTYRNMTLAALEGFDFQMDFKAHLSSHGLNIDFKVQSTDHPCICGLHYYYKIFDPNSHLELVCKNQYHDKQSWKSIPDRWEKKNGITHLPLYEEYDYVFSPELIEEKATITLVGRKHRLEIAYEPVHSEHSFQIYHPAKSSFVCLEPVSAFNAREVQSKQGHLKIRISFHES